LFVIFIIMDITTTTKLCRHCKIEKSLTEYYAHTSDCIECCSLINKEKYNKKLKHCSCCLLEKEINQFGIKLSYCKDCESKSIKRCKTCNEVKSFNDFSLRADDGLLRNVCRVCHKQKHDLWLSKNEEKVKKTRQIYGQLPKSKEQRKRYKTHIKHNKHEIYLFRIAKARARKSNIEFSITTDDIIVPINCPVLGIPLTFDNKRLNENSPTLDRINNSFGYVKGNVCVISGRANRIKNDGTAEEHEKISNYIKQYNA